MIPSKNNGIQNLDQNGVLGDPPPATAEAGKNTGM
jgi:hypothetical protein